MDSIILFLNQSVSEGLPEGRVFGLDQQTLIGVGIQILNGIILTIILAYILYKPVKKFLQERSNKIKDQIENSDSTMTRAKELITEYEDKVANIDKEYEKVLSEARIKANEERKLIIKEANEEAERIKRRSEGILEIEKKRLKLETRPYIIELATLMAENYIAANIEKEEQEKLFDDALADLEEIKWLR